jgi:hypothetical protein
MTSMILECESFTATPLESGKLRLEIKAPVERPKETLGPREAAERLSTIFGKPVQKHSLGYWRARGLPYTQVGDRKFIYHEVAITRWAQGLGASIL